ncbi:MAG: flagellar export chaperone FliS [Candidatus Eisenbacteria bacterium]
MLAYRQQEHAHMTSERLLLLTYATAIHACREKKRGLLVHSLEELLHGLDLDQGELAQGLLRMYEYLLYAAREGRLEEVETHLRELKTAWEQVLATSSPPPSS